MRSDTFGLPNCCRGVFSFFYTFEISTDLPDWLAKPEIVMHLTVLSLFFTSSGREAFVNSWCQILELWNGYLHIIQCSEGRANNHYTKANYFNEAKFQIKGTHCLVNGGVWVWWKGPYYDYYLLYYYFFYIQAEQIKCCFDFLSPTPYLLHSFNMCKFNWSIFLTKLNQKQHFLVSFTPLIFIHHHSKK